MIAGFQPSTVLLEDMIWGSFKNNQTEFWRKTTRMLHPWRDDPIRPLQKHPFFPTPRGWFTNGRSISERRWLAPSRMAWHVWKKHKRSRWIQVNEVAKVSGIQTQTLTQEQFTHCLRCVLQKHLFLNLYMFLTRRFKFEGKQHKHTTCNIRESYRPGSATSWCARGFSFNLGVAPVDIEKRRGWHPPKNHGTCVWMDRW